MEYFDAIRFDPMHNLFLGTAKHVFKFWVKKNFLTKKDLKMLEDKINRKMNWTASAQNCFKLWWLHNITVEEQDIDLFNVLFEEFLTR